MDHERWDALTRSTHDHLTRRGAVRAGLGVVLGVAGLVAGRADNAAARDACQIRCGGERRLCKGECRDNVNPRQCKRTCEAWNDECLNHCEFKPLRRRTSSDEYDRMRRKMSG